MGGGKRRRTAGKKRKSEKKEKSVTETEGTERRNRGKSEEGRRAFHNVRACGIQ